MGNVRLYEEITMKKVMLTVWMLLCVVGIFIVPALARKGDKNATGTITAQSSTMFVVTKGTTSKGSLWLGFTFFYPKDYVEDKPVKKVRRSFKESYTVSPTRAARGEVKYVASLWRWKVDISECKAVCVYCRDKEMHKEHKYEPCQYCKKNGYHMEGRMATARGTWDSN